MGLLDWMTEGTGLGFGGNSAMPPMNPMGDATGGSMTQLPPGMPPMQGLDLPAPPPGSEGMPAPNSMGAPPAPPVPPIDNPMGDQGPNPQIGAPPPQMPPGIDPSSIGGRPGTPYPPGTDPMTAGGSPGNGPGLPAPTTINATKGTDVSAAARQPGPPMDIGTGINGVGPGLGVATPDQIRSGAGGNLSLLRAMGIDPNTANRMRGSLGAGLASVPANSSAPGLAAFSGSLGAGIEGGKKADDKTTDQQDKYLTRAIAAKKEGNNAEYQKNYLRYQIENAKAKLEAAKEKSASSSASVMNSPEQLYLRAVGATNQDGGLKILANKAREAQKLGTDSPEAKAAQAEYEKKFKEVRDQHLGTLGVDPSKIKGLESKPGFSDKNPVKDFPKDPAAAQKAFDALPEGAYFVNPKDGRLLIKKGQAAQAGGGGAANPAGSELTPPIPPTPTNPAMALAEAE